MTCREGAVRLVPRVVRLHRSNEGSDVRVHGEGGDGTFGNRREGTTDTANYLHHREVPFFNDDDGGRPVRFWDACRWQGGRIGNGGRRTGRNAIPVCIRRWRWRACSPPPERGGRGSSSHTKGLEETRPELVLGKRD